MKLACRQAARAPWRWVPPSLRLGPAAWGSTLTRANLAVAAGLSPNRMPPSSWFTGPMQVLERQGRRAIAMLHGLRVPMDAQLLSDGSIAVDAFATGTMARASAAGLKDRGTLSRGLARPVHPRPRRRSDG